MVDDGFDKGNAFAHRTLDRIVAAYQTLDESQRATLQEMLAEHLNKH